MNNDDIKKGIAIQAKVDAEKVEKLARGLQAHKDMLSSLEKGQEEIRDAIGIVIDDMLISEAKALYNLPSQRKASELDSTEKRALCACIYTLIVSKGQNSPLQLSFYDNLEQCLGVSERESEFVFENLNNIDSHSERMVFLRAICSFLFLKDCDFSFLSSKSQFAWLFDFATLKDLGEVCGIINSEYATLGSAGLISYYKTTPSIAINDNADSFESSVEDKSENSNCYELSASDNEYQELQQIIVNYLADETSFGKGVALNEKEFSSLLKYKNRAVAFDSLIAVSKIEYGYLFFTTYAFYLRTSGNPFIDYNCVPYSSIDINGICTEQGKRTGTRKLIIPVFEDDGSHSTIIIDNALIQEEKFRNLIIDIVKSNCKTAESDQYVNLLELSQESIEEFISFSFYLLNNNKLPFIDCFFIARLLFSDDRLPDGWERIVNRIHNNSEFDLAVKHFLDSLPAQSKTQTAFNSMRYLILLLSDANEILGKKRTTLPSAVEEGIRKLDTREISPEEFNSELEKPIDFSFERIMDNYGGYQAIKNFVLEREISHKEQLVGFLDELISIQQKKREANLGFKAKQAIGSTAKNVLSFTQKTMDKVSSRFKKGNEDRDE